MSQASFGSAGAAIESTRTDLVEAHQRMQASHAEQETARRKIEDDCRKQTETFETRFTSLETIVHGLMGNLQKLETTITGMQGQVAEARRAQEASTESIVSMLKKLVPADDEEPKAPAKGAARRSGSASPDDARGRSRSKERRLAEKKAKAAKDGTSGTD